MLVFINNAIGNRDILPMEQHGNKLNHHDGEEEEHEDNTDGLEVEILFGDQNLNER